MKPHENANFGNWLRTCFSNCCRNYLIRRRNILNRGVFESDFKKKVVYATANKPENPEETAIKNEEREKSRKIIQKNLPRLAPAWREALIGFYFNGLRTREIAERTGTTRKNIIFRLMRGRQRLKQLLMDEPYVLERYFE